MQWLKIILITAAASGPTVSATCFGSGPSSTDKGIALQNLDTMCTALKGYYRPEEKRNFCTRQSDVTKWDFTVKNINGGGTLTHEACLSGLKKEINNCKMGGHTEYKNWAYTSDSNNGVCQDKPPV